jgi:septum formation inhibitor MinC
VVVGSVNAGSEVLADGDIYIFGRLCGRCVAGLGHVTENQKTPASISPYHIYVTTFEASLVGIGDAYMVPDEDKGYERVRGKSVAISIMKTDEAESLRNNPNHPSGGKSIVSVVNCDESKQLSMVFRLI